MSRVFAYCRVSTADQTYENQIHEIQTAGFSVEPRRVIAETVSGSILAMERKGFRKLIDRLDWDDVLIVTKLDRLGRNAMDVRATVEQLAEMHVRVHCLALDGVDLCSAAGKMTMAVIAAVAEFERDLLIERTEAGLVRAKAQGKKLGRPSRLTHEQQRLFAPAAAKALHWVRWRRNLASADRPSSAPSVESECCLWRTLRNGAFQEPTGAKLTYGAAAPSADNETSQFFK